MNVTFDYGGKALIWEMRIWNPTEWTANENGVAVYGSEATIQIGRWDRRWGYKLFDRAGKLVEHNDADDEADDHMRNFIDCIRTRKLPNADVSIGHLSALHCHLANIVARTGRNVDFDQESEQAINERRGQPSRESTLSHALEYPQGGLAVDPEDPTTTASSGISVGCLPWTGSSALRPTSGALCLIGRNQGPGAFGARSDRSIPH